MRMLMAILLVAGWAEATTLKTGHLPAATRGYSPVEKVGCGGLVVAPQGSTGLVGRTANVAAFFAAIFILTCIPSACNSKEGTPPTC